MTTAEKICKKINSYLRTIELIIGEKGDATPYLEKLELWIDQLLAEAEKTSRKEKLLSLILDIRAEVVRNGNELEWQGIWFEELKLAHGNSTVE
ncbi:hypothetical protein BLOT_013510 [Blomia tropicalis]|nr:hypothetical protein BLOT_013510 [Blomia tropicalis]